MKRVISFVTISMFILTSTITTAFANPNERIKEVRGILKEKNKEVREVQENLGQKVRELREEINEKQKEIRGEINEKSKEINEILKENRKENRQEMKENRELKEDRDVKEKNNKEEEKDLKKNFKEMIKVKQDAFKKLQKQLGEEINELQKVFKSRLRELKNESVVKRTYRQDDESVHSSVYGSVYKSVYKSVYDSNYYGQEMKRLNEKLRILKQNYNQELKDIRKEIHQVRKAQNDNRIMMFVNGGEVESDVPPIIKEGRTLIPVNAIATSLGAKVKWEPETRTVSVSKEVYNEETGTTNLEIRIKIDSVIMIVNNKEVRLDVPAQICNNRTVLPVRAIAEAMFKNIEWEPETNSVVVEDKEI